MSLRAFILKTRLRLKGFIVWSSWSGFAVNTDWPDPKYKEQIETISKMFDKYLPKNWCALGPKLATGGVLVMYAWPKKDPNLQRVLNGEEPAEECD